MEFETPKTALLFPGQGSQFAGMGKELYQRFPPAQKLLDQACEILDFDLKEIMFGEDDEALRPTQIAQPAMYVCDSMFFEHFRSKGISFEAVAGHSLGEYAALQSAGVFSFGEGLQLVAERGLLMQEACDLYNGGMTAVIGSDHQSIQDAISTVRENVVIANLNAKTQVVISGLRTSLEKVGEVLTAKGAIVKPLRVAGAFHSSFMKQAAEKMALQIDNVNFHAPVISVIPNTLAKLTNVPNEIREALKAQMTGQVRWFETMGVLEENAFTNLYEIGPGDTLRKMQRMISVKLKCQTLIL